MKPPTRVSLVVSLVGKESACNMGDLSSIPGLGRSPGEGKGYPLHYSGLENPMDLCKDLDTTELLTTSQENEDTEPNLT